MFPLPDGETVVRERGAPVLDPYSQEQTGVDWSAPASLDIVGAAIAPSSSSEAATVDRRTLISSMSLYCGTGEDILPADRIRARSGLWEVEGEVAAWHNPLTGWDPGSEYLLKKVTG